MSIKKMLILLLSILIISYTVFADTISRHTTYATGSEVNATNLNGNFDNVYNEVNGNLTNDNADTAGGFRFIEVLGSLPAAGTEGRTIFLTTDDTLNFDDGSSFNQAITVSGTPSADDIPIYTTTWARVQYIPAENMSGFEIQDVAGDDLTIVVQAGKLIHGNISIQKTTNTTLTFATAGDWWDGATDTYAGGAAWNYIGVDSSGNIKFLGNNPPDVHDADGNANGTNYYFDDGTKKWRVIDAIYIDTDDKAHAVGHIQRGDFVMYDIPLSVTTSVSAGSWSGATAVIMPTFSEKGVFGLKASDDAATTGVWVRPNGTTWAVGDENGVTTSSGGASSDTIGGQRACATDASQQIQYQNQTGDNATAIDIEGYDISALRG